MPKASWLCTVSMPETTPAVTVTTVFVIDSLLATAGVMVSTCVAEVMALGEVLAAVIVGDPACVSV